MSAVGTPAEEDQLGQPSDARLVQILTAAVVEIRDANFCGDAAVGRQRLYVNTLP